MPAAPHSQSSSEDNQDTRQQRPAAAAAGGVAPQDHLSPKTSKKTPQKEEKTQAQLAEFKQNLALFTGDNEVSVCVLNAADDDLSHGCMGTCISSFVEKT